MRFGRHKVDQEFNGRIESFSHPNTGNGQYNQAPISRGNLKRNPRYYYYKSGKKMNTGIYLTA